MNREQQQDDKQDTPAETEPQPCGEPTCKDYCPPEPIDDEDSPAEERTAHSTGTELA